MDSNNHHLVLEVEIKKRIWKRDILTCIESHLESKAQDGVTSLGCAVQRDVFVDQDNLINSSEPRYSVFRIRTATKVPNRRALLFDATGNVKLDGGDQSTVKYVGTVKSPTVLANGIARTDEDEVTLTSETATQLLTAPSKGLGTYNNPFLDRVVSRFSLDPTRGVTQSGKYTTIRSKYKMDCWTAIIQSEKGVAETPVLELDETIYEFGSAFEIEVETYVPEFVEKLLMDFIKEAGCAEGVTNSVKSKYTNFLKGNVDGVVLGNGSLQKQ
ncbi:UNVERIFIED_CONTAM: hypothetical protein HDU68_006757 [Siphonaria sp. JEL0065]|nr:hypothetical protein HDU68_006757 [Siphonaria sp. JEL0065]